MIIEAVLASLLVAAASLVGVLFFGKSVSKNNTERYIVPLAVGVFLSLVLYELIPETLLQAPEIGGIAVMAGFVGFYVLANLLHKRYHHLEADDCDRKGAAAMILTGDAIHNLADGVILGGAFLINPAVGVATAVGLAIHEIPQEIVEFGVLVRAGYTRTQAALRNLLSASSIVVGTLLILVVAEHAADYVWILTGFAAGNLLFLAASELLPRIHGTTEQRQHFVSATVLILLGFAIMSAVITWTHEEFGHGHDETSELHADEHAEEDTHEAVVADHAHEEGTPEDHAH